MKKITLLAFAAFMALSCSDEENAVPVPLNGIWKLTYADLNGEPEDLNNDGVASENYLNESNCLENSTITFGENSTAVFSPNCMSQIPGTSENTTYTISGNSVTFTYHVITDPWAYKEGVYTRSGNTLTATYEEPEDGSYPYIPGDGENGDTNSSFRGATFVYTKE